MVPAVTRQPWRDGKHRQCEGAEEQPEAPAADMDADSDSDCAAAAAAAAAAATMDASAADTASGTSTSAQRDTPPSRQLGAANNTAAMFR